MKDGGAIAVMTLSKALSSLGVDLTILSMNTRKHYFPLKKIPKEITEKINLKTIDVPAEISTKSIISNYLFSHLPYTASRFIDEKYSLALIELFQKQNFDIVQLEGLYLAPYIPLIKKHTDAKIVMRAHNVEQLIWKRVKKNTGNFLKKIYLSNLIKRLERFEISYFNSYDLLLPITEKDASLFEKMGYTKEMYVLPTGIDLENYKITENIKKVYPQLFYLGALDWEPNTEGLYWFLEKVWPNIIKKYPNVKLNIAGRNASKSTSDFLKKQKNIVYLGEVEDALDYMNQQAIMLVPLLSGSGMRIKIIEGMALSKVIVASSIAMEGISAVDGRDFLLADKEEDYIEKIEMLLENLDKYQEIAENARDFIKNNFDNKEIVSKLLYKYEKLIVKSEE